MKYLFHLNLFIYLFISGQEITGLSMNWWNYLQFRGLRWIS